MKKNIIAIIYDFDGTLSPQPMQEYTVFPELNIKPKKFWEEVKTENKKIAGEEIIIYMMLMLKKANEKNLKISKDDLGKMAEKIKFFPGVITYFKRINDFVSDASKKSKVKIEVRHYIISSGLKEILDKIKIRKEFHNIFASEYRYDIYGAPMYPKLVVTDTVKTQFLFRINKGRENLLENINEFVGEEDRPIPFSNIIYIGDGMTDVPCMTVAMKSGGYAIAVFPRRKRKNIDICKTLFENARVDYIAESDYTKNSELDKFLKIILKGIIQRITYEDIQQISKDMQQKMVKKRYG